MFWRSKEESSKLEAETNKAVRNIALFMVLGSMVLNLIPWLTMSMIKFDRSFVIRFLNIEELPPVAMAKLEMLLIQLEQMTLQELLNIKPLPSIVIGMGIAILYTMWMVKNYRQKMGLFKGDPNEEICAEEKKKAMHRIGLCGPLCTFGWLITMLIINRLKG